MQFGGAAYHAVLDIGNDQRAVVGAFFGVTLDKAVIHEAVETIMAAGTIQPQKVIAQKRQLFLLAESPNGALGPDRSGSLVGHIITPRENPRGGVDSLDQLYCAPQYEVQAPQMP